MAKTYKLTANWHLLIRDIGIRPGDVLRRVGLPADLLAREGASVSESEFFRLWRGVEAEMEGRAFIIDMGKKVAENVTFEPAVFAALCSINLNQAAKRFSRYKKLIGPLKLSINKNAQQTALTFSSLGPEPLPLSMGLVELIFFVHFTRHATRSLLHPLQVIAPELPAPLSAFEDFFGVRITKGPDFTVVFSAADAEKTFLTANAEMWKYFDDILSKRLAEIDFEASVGERVYAALCEILPAGQSSIQEVATMLGMSTRTLQRHLSQEQTTYNQVLNETREQLARHYLRHSKMTGAEISFLLGYDEPNSFFRAFRKWTGRPPHELRLSIT